jgi:hypothetical protein
VVIHENPVRFALVICAKVQEEKRVNKTTSGSIGFIECGFYLDFVVQSLES